MLELLELLFIKFSGLVEESALSSCLVLSLVKGLRLCSRGRTWSSASSHASNPCGVGCVASLSLGAFVSKLNNESVVDGVFIGALRLSHGSSIASRLGSGLVVCLPIFLLNGAVVQACVPGLDLLAHEVIDHFASLLSDL